MRGGVLALIPAGVMAPGTQRDAAHGNAGRVCLPWSRFCAIITQNQRFPGGLRKNVGRLAHIMSRLGE